MEGKGSRGRARGCGRRRDLPPPWNRIHGVRGHKTQKRRQYNAQRQTPNNKHSAFVIFAVSDAPHAVVLAALRISATSGGSDHVPLGTWQQMRRRNLQSPFPHRGGLRKQPAAPRSGGIPKHTPTRATTHIGKASQALSHFPQLPRTFHSRQRAAALRGRPRCNLECSWQSGNQRLHPWLCRA